MPAVRLFRFTILSPFDAIRRSGSVPSSPNRPETSSRAFRKSFRNPYKFPTDFPPRSRDRLGPCKWLERIASQVAPQPLAEVRIDPGNAHQDQPQRDEREYAREGLQVAQVVHEKLQDAHQ